MLNQLLNVHVFLRICVHHKPCYLNIATFQIISESWAHESRKEASFVSILEKKGKCSSFLIAFLISGSPRKATNRGKSAQANRKK